ncbi:MAG: type II toxin-antitoxin system PemK/MazF family toxin [Bacteroidota bacterium]
MIKGDIVLLPFPFTDLSGNKNRPAIVLFESGEDVTVCFVTSQLRRISDFDITIQPTDLNGLKKVSVVRLNKMATIDKSLVLGRLGSLDKQQVEVLDQNLVKLFRIDKQGTYSRGHEADLTTD